MNGANPWEKVNEFCIWILKVAYLNLLWIGFSILGGVVFGLFPSTGAMYSITKKWINKEHVGRMHKEFWKVYKNEFFKLNQFGLIFILVGYVLVYDFLFLQMNAGKLVFLNPILGFLSICYLVTLFYFFPVYTQFDLKFFQYIKQSFLIAASCVIETMAMVTSFFLLGIIVWFVPGIIPLFTGSVLALCFTWCSLRAIEKIKIRKKILEDRKAL